jgi:hypothetical protein
MRGSKTDKKSLFGWHRPAEAEIMPEPVWSSDITVRSLAQAGMNVKIKTGQHNPAERIVGRSSRRDEHNTRIQ